MKTLRFDELGDGMLDSLSRRSPEHGARARRLLKLRADGLRRDTRTLTDLTRTLEAENGLVRQQLGASPEDAALDELRRRFG